MRPSNRLISLAGVATAALLVAAACTSAAVTPAASVVGAQATPTAPSASMAPSASQAPTGLTIGVTNDPTLGVYLTAQNGMTLYVFKNDTPDTSSCTGSCATNWPPLTVAGGTTITGPTGATGTFSLISRPDGTMQVAYDHQPLYYYAGDSAAGDTTGQGFSGKWYVAPLTASAATSASASAAQSQSGY